MAGPPLLSPTGLNPQSTSAGTALVKVRRPGGGGASPPATSGGGGVRSGPQVAPGLREAAGRPPEACRRSRGVELREEGHRQPEAAGYLLGAPQRFVAGGPLPGAPRAVRAAGPPPGPPPPSEAAALPVRLRQGQQNRRHLQNRRNPGAGAEAEGSLRLKGSAVPANFRRGRKCSAQGRSRPPPLRQAPVHRLSGVLLRCPLD